jgi:RNA polymerase sigma factor (sigma-70 family)
MENDDKKDFCKTRETLLMRVKNKQDEKSWEDFVFYYKNFIYIICRKMGLNHHDGEEVVQKVLLKLWEKLPDFQYEKGSRFRGWLCTVTGNMVKDYHRSDKRAEDRKVKAADYEQWNPDGSSATDLETRIDKEWQNYISNLALENIKPKFSEKVMAVFLKFNEGDPVRQLSEEIGVPTNTIYVYVQRITKKLKEEIRHLCQELD